jgi:hypothetical protein
MSTECRIQPHLEGALLGASSNQRDLINRYINDLLIECGGYTAHRKTKIADVQESEVYSSKDRLNTSRMSRTAVHLTRQSLLL